MSSRLGWFAAAAGVLLAIGCAGTLQAQGPAAIPAQVEASAEKGKLIGLGTGFRALPFTSMVDLKGQTHTFEGYNGKVLVLHFWAHWCPYCRSEIEELTKLQNDEQWVRQGVQVLTVSIDQEPGKLKQFVKDQQLPYPVVVDQEQAVSTAEQYGVSGIPVTLILTRDGRIGVRMPGAGEIIENVKKVLAESPAT